MLLAPRKPRYSSKLSVYLYLKAPLRSLWVWIYLHGWDSCSGMCRWARNFFSPFFFPATYNRPNEEAVRRLSADDPRRSQPPVPIPFLSDNPWMSFENSALSCAWWKQEEKILLIWSVHPDQMRKQTCKQWKRNLVRVYVCVWEFSAAIFKN